MSEWISVKERLPECPHEMDTDDGQFMVSQSVLFCDSSMWPCMAMGHMVEDGTWTNYGGDHDFMYPETVTHWMPFPDGPDKQR